MKILAIDSSGLVASVAILDEEKILAEYSVNYKITHSQTLVPMIDEIRKMIDFDLADIDAIAIAKGPGSFTGLRIGSATAKGLGLALNKPIIPVPTVDALAMNGYCYSGIVCPIMDARRAQVYTGLYRFDEGKLVTVKQQCAISVDELIEELEAVSEDNVLFLGDGVFAYKDIIDEKLKKYHEYSPMHMNWQRAGALGVLAIEYYRKGIVESADEHRPEYLRVSQAERERGEKLNADL